MERVYLKWVDSSSFHERELLELALKDKPWIAETAGFIMAEDKKSITVAQTIFHHPDNLDAVNSYIIIPKGWILERR